MTYADRYVRALGSANLRDERRHGAAQVLAAGALAERGISGLLLRARAGGERACLDQLQALWFAEVVKHAQARKWVKLDTPWAVTSAFKLFRRIAEHSLALWLDSSCPACQGNSTHHADWDCGLCSRTGMAPVPGNNAFERERVKDMLSVLRAIEDGHQRRALRRLRG
jgi:hypothetical protein